MPFEIVTVPCLQDNYAFLLHDSDSGQTLCVDVPEAGPIQAALTARNWDLQWILITHHHGDHIDGVDTLRAATGARVAGAAADAHRLPALDLAVAPGDSLAAAGTTLNVIDVPGHTVGHVAFYAPAAKAVFTADSLMALGCGRLFEGTPDQMWQSMQALAALPGDTLVCSGHEYTLSNARFALTIEPGNPTLVSRAATVAADRQAGRPTVPSALSLELATNPFLRAHLPGVKAAVDLPDASDVAVFAELRDRKNRF